MPTSKKPEILNTEELLNIFDKMTVSELNEFVKKIEEKYDVSASVPVASANSASAVSQEEKTTFNVVLKQIGTAKLAVVKAIKEALQIPGLMDAKKIVDEVEKGPKVIKENIDKDAAEKIKEALEKAGAIIEIA